MNVHLARKRFSQHFLRDANIVQRVVDAVAPKIGDLVVEIGPGDGVLTRALAPRVRHLHAIEIDRDLVAQLRDALAERTNIVIHQADALQFDLSQLASQACKLRLIGNLPYNISTPLLFRLLAQAHCIEDMCFMLQKEVVERLTAVPGSKAYGRLSVMIQWRCRAQPLFAVPAAAFSPRPKVDSMFIRLEPYVTPPVVLVDESAFACIVTAAFATRRKTLRNALAGMLSADELHALGVDPGRRGETLTLAEFAVLGNALAHKQAR